MLAERSSQMTMNMHDIDNKRVSITKLESDLRTEKVMIFSHDCSDIFNQSMNYKDSVHFRSH